MVWFIGTIWFLEGAAFGFLVGKGGAGTRPMGVTGHPSYRRWLPLVGYGHRLGDFVESGSNTRGNNSAVVAGAPANLTLVYTFCDGHRPHGGLRCRDRAKMVVHTAKTMVGIALSHA